MKKIKINLLLISFFGITQLVYGINSNNDGNPFYLKDSIGFISSENKKHKSLRFVPNYPSPPKWIWQELGSNFGTTIFDAIDFDLDGSKELIVNANEHGNNEGSLIVLKSDLQNLKCAFDFESMPQDIHYYQFDDDISLEIVLATLSEIVTIDIDTCNIQLIYEFDNDIDAVALGDTNNDNIPDFAYSYNGHLYVSSISNTQSPLVRFGFGGSNLFIEPLGRLDGDDIGVYNNSHTILNGEDLSTIIEILDFNPNYYSYGDFNGDGPHEITGIKHNSNGLVSIYNIYTGSNLSEFSISLPKGFAVQNINNDAKDELLLHYEEFTDNVIVAKDLFGNDVLNIILPRTFLIRSFKFTEIVNNIKDLLIITDHIFDRGGLLRYDMQSEMITYGSQEDLIGPYQLSKGFINRHNNIEIGISGNFFLQFDTDSKITLFDINSGHITNFNEYINYIYRASPSLDIGQHSSISYPIACVQSPYSYQITCSNALTEDVIWQNRIKFTQQAYFMKLQDYNNDSSLDLLVIFKDGSIFLLDSISGQIIWEAEHKLANEINLGFKDVFLVNNELWVLSNSLYKFDPVTGNTIEVINNTGLTTIDFAGNKLYGAKIGEGFGEININDLSISNLIFPQSEVIYYLNVSEDGKVAFVSYSNSVQPIPVMKNITLVSINNDFTPWEVGDAEVYDTNFPDQFNLYTTNIRGIQKYDLRALNEHIFSNGFD